MIKNCNDFRYKKNVKFETKWTLESRSNCIRISLSMILQFGHYSVNLLTSFSISTLIQHSMSIEKDKLYLLIIAFQMLVPKVWILYEYDSRQALCRNCIRMKIGTTTFNKIIHNNHATYSFLISSNLVND